MTSQGFEIVKEAMGKLLNDTRTKGILGLPVTNVSKFEHWLKIELGYQLSQTGKIKEKNGKIEIEFEPHYHASKKMADISFTPVGSDNEYFIELKTARSHRKKEDPGIISSVLERDLNNTSKNRGVIQDIQKIKSLQENNNEIHGIVVFAIFPIQRDMWEKSTEIQNILKENMEKSNLNNLTFDVQEFFLLIEETGFVYFIIDLYK